MAVDANCISFFTVSLGCAPDLIEPGRTGEVAAANSVESLREALLRAMAWMGEPAVRVRCRERIAAYTVEKAAEGITLAFHAVAGIGTVSEGHKFLKHLLPHE